MPWTPEDDQILREHQGRITAVKIGKLLGRSAISVRVRAHLIGITKRRSAKPPVDRYKQIVLEACKERRLNPVKVFAGDRHQRYSKVRWMAWSTLRDESYSLLAIGDLTGFDHTSVRYGIQQHRARAAA